MFGPDETSGSTSWNVGTKPRPTFQRRQKWLLIAAVARDDGAHKKTTEHNTILVRGGAAVATKTDGQFHNSHEEWFTE